MESRPALDPTRVMEILDRALELDGARRLRYLEEACAGDAALRTELDQLLAEEDALSDGFLQDPAAAFLDTATISSYVKTGRPEPPELPGQLGPYRVLRELGRGGMSVVYLAEQEEPVRRVAVKVLEALHQPRRRQRFLAECRALARLNHPNVAALHEVGATDEGEPFVVMEYVDGTAIHTWCDERRLDLRSRLELFLGACAGVRHAHEKGILHRDLKPSNILVTEVDGQAVAKVIDFGIARAFEGPDLSDIRMTLDQQLIGSPAYMSPEAASLDPTVVDTRSDVYSLGLVLYELLVGVLPFDVRQETLPGLLRRVAEEDPPAPTIRFAQLAPERKEELASRRSLTAEELRRQVRGDLDMVVWKAIHRRHERRYSSPSDLAADLERYLHDEPVTARPPSTAYRVRKFARRHRGGVTAAVLVLVALVAGILTTSLALVRAWQAEQQARENFGRAQQAVNDFLTQVSESDLLETPGARPVRKRLLERARRYYEAFIRQHGRDPALKLELALANLRVGRINDDLGDHRLSLDAWLRGLAILDELVAAEPGHPEYRYHQADATHRAAWAYYYNGQAEKAFAVGQRAVALQEALVADHPRVTRYRELLALGLADRSEALEVVGQDEAAVELSRRSLELLRELDREHAESGRFRAQLALFNTRYGDFLYRVDRFEEALEVHEVALQIYREQLRAHPGDRESRARHATGLSSYTEALLRVGRWPDAGAALDEGLEIWRELRDEFPFLAKYRYDHALDLRNLAQVHVAGGRFRDATETYLRGIGLLRDLRAADPANLVYRLQLGHQLNGLARVHLAAGAFDDALEAAGEAAHLLTEYVRENPGIPDVQRAVGTALQTRAASLHALGRLAEAIRAQESLVSVLAPMGGDARFEAALAADREAAEDLLARWRRDSR